MKRCISVLLVVGMVITAVVLTGCNTVTSSVSYSLPVTVVETGVFYAKANTYAKAWYTAVQNGKSEGFTTILTETTERNSMFNQVVVTVIMVKPSTVDVP